MDKGIKSMDDDKIALIAIAKEYLDELKTSLTTCEMMLCMVESFVDMAHRKEVELKAAKLNNRILYIEKVLHDVRNKPASFC